MKTNNQKRKSFSQEMERLQKEKNLKEDKQSFENILKRAASIKNQKPTSH